MSSAHLQRLPLAIHICKLYPIRKQAKEVIHLDIRNCLLVNQANGPLKTALSSQAGDDEISLAFQLTIHLRTFS